MDIRVSFDNLEVDVSLGEEAGITINVENFNYEATGVTSADLTTVTNNLAQSLMAAAVQKATA